MDERATSIDGEELLAHAGWVRSLARRLARDHESAEDLVQETWLTALRKAPRRGPDLRGWLARVLTNSARRQRRGDARRTEREARTVRAGADPSGEELVLEVEGQQTVSHVVLRLAEPYRSVILCHYWRGMSPAQIARRSGTSAATVRSQLSRAHAELRKALRDHHGDERAMRAGLLAAAGPPPLSWLATCIQGALVLKQSEKLGWIAAAGLTVAFVAGGWNALRTGDVGATVAQAPVSPDLEPLDPAPRGSAAGETHTPEARVAIQTPASAEADPTVAAAGTGLVVHFVDRSGAPLPDAILRTRDGSETATSDAQGRARLRVPEASLHVWRGRPMTSSFVAECAGYATRFVLATPIEGEDTDIGELVMEPGGSLAGLVVDGAGVPLDDIRVFATGVALEDSLESLRSKGPDMDAGLPSGTSENGRFVVRGVPAGHARLWARAPGTGWVVTDPIVVTQRSETGGVRIVLATLAPEDLIAGFVRDSSGEPVAGAGVRFSFPSERRGFGTVQADTGGRFEIIAEVREPHDLSVEDRARRLRPTIVRDVVPGSGELTIVLPEPRWMRVAAVDAKTGEPLSEPWIYTRGEDTLEYDSRAAREADELGPGERFVRVPQNRFMLHVKQDGYVPYEVGPFTPAGAPEQHEAVLAPLAGVSGLVTFEGKPVAGATVQLLRVPEQSFSITSYGFRMRVDPYGDASVETGPDGRFTIGTTEAGFFSLLVTQDGFATGERGPLEIDPRLDVAGVDVALVRGGAIEGAVLVPSGRDPSGKIISISRGDGDVRFERTGEDGSFRFERLAPGGWHIAHRDREARLSVTYKNFKDGAPPIEWDCEVVDGGTTRHDIDLRDTLPGVLRGQLSIDAVGASGWSASLVRAAGAEVLDPVRAVTLAPDGSFELRGAPGEWRLRVQSPLGAEPEVWVFADVTLGADPIDWTTNLATGTLSGTSHRGDAALRFGWKDEAGISCSATFTPTEHGTFHVAVPAGAGRLSRLQPGEPPVDRAGWFLLRDAAVESGMTTDVDLP